ncbi:DUF5677 domain-containing protein [Burkholderia pseudomallei]|uniref:DUF5677 domain-containing protein n=1 Tax=Burkholderia pseudomallei TaxID=28450 RepID=UPI000530D622|nr:DUF5677 domain-containing protein [Burkholderia pseudomallei]KGS63018.1 hypothetical protein X990_1298 [Burkholderia pseudomallei MSHR4868]KGW22140.1 hypothetical protein Y602_910 [Burkholderia pseudomallei MSHR733]RAQ86197.1 hypothetical protein A4G85_13985 [Burkholderia pseudomallei]
MDKIENPFPPIERIEVDPATIGGYTRESQFVELAFNLLREVASYVCIAACTLGPAPAWNRDQAAIGGNMVRLFKLLSAFLDQTVQDRPETSSIISRLAFETIVNVRYMVANFSPTLIDSYVRHSLRHERRLWDMVNANIAGRGGEVLPIEQRMLNSLDRAARVAGIALDSIDLKDKAPWGRKDLRQKAVEIGLDGAYEAVFGGMSHNVHGSWQDVYQFHLETDGDGLFRPKLEWGRLRPQALFALGVIALGAVHDFIRFIGGEGAVQLVRAALEDLTGRLRIADEAHEAYLAGKQWPEI